MCSLFESLHWKRDIFWAINLQNWLWVEYPWAGGTKYLGEKKEITLAISEKLCKFGSTGLNCKRTSWTLVHSLLPSLQNRWDDSQLNLYLKVEEKDKSAQLGLFFATDMQHLCSLWWKIVERWRYLRIAKIMYANGKIDILLTPGYHNDKLFHI